MKFICVIPNDAVMSSSGMVDVCRLPSDIGTCGDFISAFFYDPLFGQCLEFFWSGCGGNENRFETIEECENRCVNVETVDITKAAATTEETPPTVAPPEDTGQLT